MQVCFVVENDFFVNLLLLTSVYDKVFYRDTELGILRYIYLSKRIERLS